MTSLVAVGNGGESRWIMIYSCGHNVTLTTPPAKMYAQDGRQSFRRYCSQGYPCHGEDLVNLVTVLFVKGT